MKQIIIRYTILLMVLIISISDVYSQEIKNFKKNINAFILKFDASKNEANRDNIKDILNKQLNIRDENFELLSENNSGKELKKDKLGLTHERFVQFYKGIKVEGSDIRVHYKDDNVVSVNGEYSNSIDIDINPFFFEEEAINKAKEFIHAKKYRWEIPEENAWLQEKKNDINVTFYPKAELVICKNRLNPLDSPYHLAYKVNISAIEPMSNSFVFVDAKDGLILNNQSLIFDLNGTAATRYSGSQPIQTTYISPNYILKDITRGNYIETKNMQNGTNYSNAVEFTDGNNDWTNAEFHNANKDDAALDAHWGMMMTYDYFLNIHERDSYDGQGAKIKNYIHDGNFYYNAGWDSSIEVFGFGDSGNYPITCLDIVAHEFGHAFCSHSAGLYYNSESGAINESLSDIWGACVEHYAAPSKSMWEIGEDLGSPSRSMSNPKSYEQPDTYYGDNYFETNNCIPIGDPTNPNYNDNCGVHTNSGVMNHWFYILVNGKDSMNDLDNAYHVEGIGLDNATKIVYFTELTFSPGSTFDYIRELSINKAEEWFGNYSSEVVATTNAWYAVGVGDEFECDDWQSLFGEDYTTDTTIPACNIDLYEVTVTNGAKLTLDVANTTIITGPFEIASSSQFEVK